MFICKVATEYTLACGEGVPSPNNPQRVDDTMLTTSHIVPSVSMAIERVRYLYDRGNEYTDITGGWNDVTGWTNATFSSYSVLPFVKNVNNMTSNLDRAGHFMLAPTSNMIDLTPYASLKMEVSGRAGVQFSKTKTANLNDGWYSDQTVDGVVTINISALTDFWYIAPGLQGNLGMPNYTIYKIWLEP